MFSIADQTQRTVYVVESEHVPGLRGDGGQPADGSPAQTMSRGAALHGLTLTELLVVIALVGILAAVTTAALLRGAAHGRQAGCASNLRQIALAVRLYAADYDGIPPRWSTIVPPGSSRYELALKTIERLEPYGASREVWFCPADPDRGNPGVTTDLVPHWITSYDYPGWDTLVGWPEGRVPPPDILELNSSAREHFFVIALDARNLTRDPVLLNLLGRGSWHSGGFNIAYIDGHVRWFPLRRTGDEPIPNPFLTEQASR